MDPKISVYVTSFNQEKYLPLAIESVLNQTLNPYEILIIDDASTDNSVEIIKKYKIKYPKLIKVFINKENKGISKCRNIALKNFNGDYLTYLDGDDYFNHSKLEIEYKVIKQGKGGIVFSNFDIVDENGVKIETWQYEEKQNFDIYKKALLRDFPYNSLFRYELFSREVLEKHSYNECLKIYEDYDFKLNYLLNYSPQHISFVGSSYRRHDQGLSKSPSKLHQKSLIYIYSNQIKKYRKAETFNEIKSADQHRKIIKEKLLNLYWQLAVGENMIFLKLKYFFSFLIQKLF